MKKYLYFSSILFLFACGTKHLTKTQPAESTKPVAASASSLEAGKTLYANSCGTCHKLKAPEELTVTQWNEVIPRMAKKAKIDAATEKSITDYLHSLAKKG